LPDIDATACAAPERSFSLPVQAVVDALGVDPARGLADAEVGRRRQRFGPNRLRETRRRGAARILWDQVASPIVALLAGATAVALAFDERLEALAIGVVLVVNTAIGFWTERRALRSMEALRRLGRVEARVRRGGSVRVVPADELVPGDVVLFEAGDVLTADLRLVAASRLQVDESALTGESLAVDKSTPACAADTALPDRSCMLFKGTSVARGSGEGVVVASGMHTELGHISQLVEEAEAQVTPLEARLDRLGRRLIALTLAIAAGVGMASVWGGRDLYLSIEVALALAVAAVPEGLPIVATVALARGMWRMARRNALVEQLSAVETLGSTSVLLVDKTGTLTENRMAVAELALADGSRDGVRVALEPASGGLAFRRDGEALDPEAEPLLRAALRTAALCNNAELTDRGGADGGPSPDAGVGDPTEVALLAAARAAGLERAELLADAPELREVAFDSETKRMATLHRDAEGVLAAVKGAPESVLPCCRRVPTPDGGFAPLDDAARERWLRRAELMATSGRRVLALATSRQPDPASFGYRDLTFLGLVGLLDPPRAGVRNALEACQSAGIRVVMVTGDHGGTAWHIAEATGLIDPTPDDAAGYLDARALPLLHELSEDEELRVLQAPVIARATPRQKLDLIALFQRQGAVVAMTGDGVNDAPALKKADIGVAMGRRGTQVAREAADMVLQDDELGTIVAAVAQGRAIFANIRKFVIYLMSCNVSEILAVGVASVIQGPLPLMPLQILFLNLVTDVFPALALGVGEGSPSLMRRPPRPSDEAMVGRRHWARILGLGSVIALAVIAALWISVSALGKTGRQATTISFLTLALAQLWHVFSMRSAGSRLWRNEVTRNAWIWGALLLCIALLGLAVQWPLLAGILSIADPGGDGWALALGMSALPLLVGQADLLIRGPRRRAAEAGL
jgi:Ca2+-transporting ATPase